MSIDPYPVWVTDAHGKSPRDVADEFARGHFAERREVGTFRDDGTFGLVDGVATYRVVYQAGVRNVSAATFGVYRVQAEG